MRERRRGGTQRELGGALLGPAVEFFCRAYAGDVLPALDSSGVKLFAVGIGSVESAQTFAERVELPATLLLADTSEETEAYSAIGTRNTKRDERGNNIGRMRLYRFDPFLCCNIINNCY